MLMFEDQRARSRATVIPLRPDVNGTGRQPLRADPRALPFFLNVRERPSPPLRPPGSINALSYVEPPSPQQPLQAPRLVRRAS